MARSGFPEQYGRRNGPAPFSEPLSTLLVLALVVLGALGAFARYGRPLAQQTELDRLHREGRSLPRLLVRGYYADDLIALLVVRPVRALGEVLGRIVDPRVLDGLVCDVVRLVGFAGLGFRTLQNGFVRSYALTIVGGAMCFIAYYALSGVGR